MNNYLNCCFMSPALILKHTSDDIEISWTHLQIYTLKRHKKGWKKVISSALSSLRSAFCAFQKIIFRNLFLNGAEFFTCFKIFKIFPFSRSILIGPRFSVSWINQTGTDAWLPWFHVKQLVKHIFVHCWEKVQ